MICCQFFKSALLFCACAYTGFILCAQQSPKISREQANNQFLKNKTNSAQSPGTDFKEMQPLIKDPVQTTGATISISDINKKQALFNCKDSSFKKIFSSGSLSYSTFCSVKTSDGGIIMGGFGRNLTDPPPYIFYGILIKVDSIGNFIWAKELRANGTGAVNVQAIQEMSDGNLIISGSFDNETVSGSISAMAAKLTASGGLIWVKTFISATLVCGAGSTRLTPNQITEGANGDILIAGFVTNCSISQYTVLYKLNSSGLLRWSDAFEYPANDGIGVGVYHEGSTVKLISKAGGGIAGSTNVVHIDLLRIDDSTGALASFKSWQVNEASPASFWVSFSNQLYTRKLDNGNYCVYGELNGDVDTVMGISHHFGVIEFDPADDFVKGYTINSPLVANANNTSNIKIAPSGRGAFSLFVNYKGGGLDFFMGSLDNGNILKLRERHYANTFLYGLDTWELFTDKSYLLLKLVSDADNSNERIEYSKMHDTDTSSECLGTDSSFCYTTKTVYVPYSFSFSNFVPNALFETENGGMVLNTQVHTPIDVCNQVNGCDTVKIHGQDKSCDLTKDFIFTAFKNRECGTIVQWTMDTSETTLFSPVNDTTVKIHFRNNWSGYLYATIPTNCGLLRDSLLLSFINSPGKIDFGPDINICTGNTVVLHAKRGFNSYKWQDGSTDSIFTVTTQGTYFVEATDNCDQIFRDTIIITAAPSVPLDAGLDRIKCNDDTIHLNAPPGFLNYTWSPGYNTSSTSEQDIIVDPAADTSYFIKGEKSPGCFGFDTVRILVRHSPPINLGVDTGFCIGANLTLDAGTGFSQYLWSTGMTAQQITVNTANKYFVAGTTIEGCRSYDTIDVKMNALPVVTLDPNPNLCKDDTRILDAGEGFVTYLWNDGSAEKTFAANSIGTYSVSVTDIHGCKGSGTTTITSIVPVPSSFLPPDTAICSYGKFELRPIQSYKKYLWSTNATSPKITVTQIGTYWLRVTDNNNCIGNDSIIVNEKECIMGFFIPSAFTPNDDGKNDSFKPLLLGNVKQFQFSVFNKWGQVVFQTSELGKGWDGAFSGKKQSADIFVWTCTYQFEGGEVKSAKGTVALIR